MRSAPAQDSWCHRSSIQHTGSTHTCVYSTSKCGESDHGDGLGLAWPHRAAVRMPILAYVDFIPRLIDEKSSFSTLSLSSGVPGPLFEGFDSLVGRANLWLKQNPDAHVISCETIVLEGVYDFGVDDAILEEDDDEGKLPAFLSMLRLWYRTSGGGGTGQRGDSLARSLNPGTPEQLSYKNILPARLESNPDSFCPKYECLSDALKAFNNRMNSQEEILPGRAVSMETVTCRFTTKNCSVEPGRTFWMCSSKEDVHNYNYFRIFFVLGRHQINQIGFTDFAPQYSGNPKKSSKSKAEQFIHLTRRADQWCHQAAKGTRVLGVQTLDHCLYYKCIRDTLGNEKRVLDNPHSMHSPRHPMFHTKVLRLYSLQSSSPPDGTANSSTKTPHILHKTFHVGATQTVNELRLNDGDNGTLLPHDMEEVLAKARRWVAMTGVKVTGAETVGVTTCRGREAVSAENTHFQSHGGRLTCCLYALRLYVEDEAGSLSKKDLSPDPKTVKLVDNLCTIL